MTETTCSPISSPPPGSSASATSEETSPPASASTSAAPSANGSSTGNGNATAEPGGASVTGGSTNGHYPSSSVGSRSTEAGTTPETSLGHDKLPTQIDAMALTTASWLTLTQVGFRMSLGLSEREVARELGVPKKQIEQRLDALREELLDQ